MEFGWCIAGRWDTGDIQSSDILEASCNRDVCVKGGKSYRTSSIASVQLRTKRLSIPSNWGIETRCCT